MENLIPSIMIGLGVGGFVIVTPALALGGMQENRRAVRYIMFIAPGTISILLLFVGLAILGAG